MTRPRKLLAAIPIFPYEGLTKTVYNSILIFAALAGTIITSYRLTFRIHDIDWVYWVITSIYALDILYSFNQSVKKGLKVIGDRKGIARIYLRGWFALDLVSTIPFALLLPAAASGQPETSSLAMALDAIMITKILKMVKISKVSAIFRDIRESLSVNPALMRLVTFGFWFLTVVHLMACGWVLIGASETARSAGDQYLCALYWCVTTIATIGYGDYLPNHDSNVQIIYTIAVMVFGVGMYGYIIGNVATLIANLDVARASYQNKMEEVNDFFRTHRVPVGLQGRVRSYFAYLWETKKSIAKVSIAEELPHTLAMEISLFLNRSILEKVSLFKNANEIFVREIVQLLRPMVFLPDDYIIRQGEFGDVMYFLSNGDVEVIVHGVRVATLGQGSPFGETALLQGEKRNASIRALTYCDVYSLSKTDLDGLRARYPDFDQQVRKVAAARLKDTQEKTGTARPGGSKGAPARSRKSTPRKG